MIKMKKWKEKNLTNDRDWKEKNREYTKELQRFFDQADSIKDTNVRTSVINQALQCDKVVTKIAEDMFSKYYQQGYQQAKKDNF